MYDKCVNAFFCKSISIRNHIVSYMKTTFSNHCLFIDLCQSRCFPTVIITGYQQFFISFDSQFEKQLFQDRFRQVHIRDQIHWFFMRYCHLKDIHYLLPGNQQLLFYTNFQLHQVIPLSICKDQKILEHMVNAKYIFFIDIMVLCILSSLCKRFRCKTQSFCLLSHQIEYI